MHKLHAILSALILSSCLQLSAQKTVGELCHVPRDAFSNQAMPEELRIPNVPKTSRRVSCFRSFKKDSTIFDVVKKCGMPDAHTGSGLYIFVYYMNDCSTVTISTPDLKHLGIRHVRNGVITVLPGDW